MHWKLQNSDEMKEETNEWKEIPCSLEDLILLKCHTTQSDQQIQWNSKKSQWYFHRTREGNPEIHMEPWKTLSSQSNLNKEEKTGVITLMIVQNISQSYNN